MTRRVVLALAALMLLALLGGCAAQPAERTVFAMDTVMTLRLWGSEAAADDAVRCINQLEQQLSVTRPESEIARLNAGGSAALPPDTAELLRQSLALCQLTGGALDITIGPVAALWGFSTGDYRLPQADVLAAALRCVDYRAVSWQGDMFTLPQGGAVTLGAVAKGYAADVLCRQLRQAGAESAVLNLGGNVQTLGTRPGGGDWQIAIRDPADEGALLGTLWISGSAAVVTSGGYQRWFQEDGTVYHHILDPATGYPARSGLTSVTIVASSGLYADALSTAVYVMGKDAALALWRQQGDFDMVLVDDGGRVYQTGGLRLTGVEAEVLS